MARPSLTRQTFPGSSRLRCGPRRAVREDPNSLSARLLLWSALVAGGERLAFTDNEHKLWIVPPRAGSPCNSRRTPTRRFRTTSGAGWSLARLRDHGANQQSGIWLYNLDTRKSTRVSDPRSNDFNPGFDAAGRYLYFSSTRHENPTLSRSEFNIATLKMAGIYVATLKKGAPSPFAPRSDEGAVSAPEHPADEGAKKAKEPVAPKPLQIDLEGLTGPCGASAHPGRRDRLD